MTSAEHLTWLPLLAMVLAAVAGFTAAGRLGAWLRKRALRRSLAYGGGQEAVLLARGKGGRRTDGGEPRSFEQWITDAMAVRSRAISMGARKTFLPTGWTASRRASAAELLGHAGLAGLVTPQGLWDTAVSLALLGMFAGSAAGALLSAEMSIAAALAGAVCGWRAPCSAVKKMARRRADELERSLSEMLEVVALGLRSGLSFDRSLGLYSSHFDCSLARGIGRAQVQWGCGLTTREEALRLLATSYDSLLFGRVVETIVRSVRFGSSLADNLDDAAREARAHYRTARQESVAKAPVKMMLPTSTLILPAMLLMVLGPVLLELMG